MKSTFILLFLLAVPNWGWLMRVHERNAGVVAAQRAQARGAARGAVREWSRAVAAEPASVNPALLLNLGQAQMRAGQTIAARLTFGRLLNAPAAIGSVARQQLAVLASQQGELVVALGLLREALRLNPHNASARYDYEVLRAYLNRQSPEGPGPPPPSGGPAAPQSQSKSEQDPAAADPGRKPKPKPGAGPEKQPTSPQAGAGDVPPQPRPASNGQPDAAQPSAAAGNTATGQRQAGDGASQPVPKGTRPGSQHGIDSEADAGTDAPTGTSRRPGTEAARATDIQLQTQRERLKALNLTPAQARQVLDALRMQEKQYLQQLTRPALTPTDPTKPTW